MRVVIFCHSALSDWNHGNAHFLRGIATVMVRRGHDVQIYEPRDAWSVRNLVEEQGEKAILKFHARYPELCVFRYDADLFDLASVLDRADLVLVHEWNDPELVVRIGRHRRNAGDYCLLFHDTHHRSVTAPESMREYDLRDYDGVLAYGASIRDVYLRLGLSSNVWVWHEAADTSVFHPNTRRAAEDSSAHRSGDAEDRSPSENGSNGSALPESYEGDLVWIGNWGDDERVAELQEFLIDPVKELGLKARVYGVRYPPSAKEALAGAGIEYAGWLPNFEVPKVFSRFRMTVHIPRRPYAGALPGIPTIRPFEALACGIPLVSAHWDDSEHLFAAGRDYLVARNGAEMKGHLQTLLDHPRLACELADHGRRTILERHTCAHRVDELFSIYRKTQSAAQGVLA